MLRLVERNAVMLYLSKPILREIRRTLAYPEIRQANPQVTDEIVEAFIARLLFRGTLVRDVPHALDYPRDPYDEPYIYLAVAVDADFLVTRDKDLLSLQTAHSIEAKQFRQRLPRLKVTDPVTFLAQVSPS